MEVRSEGSPVLDLTCEGILGHVRELGKQDLPFPFSPTESSISLRQMEHM